MMVDPGRVIEGIIGGVVAGAILSGVGWVLANHKTIGPALAKRPWAVSALTAFATTLVVGGAIWWILGVTQGEFDALKQELRTATRSTGQDIYGTREVQQPTPGQLGKLKTVDGKRSWSSPVEVVEWKDPQTGQTGQTDYTLECNQGYYMFAVHFTADSSGTGAQVARVSAVQIKCSKLIQ